MPNFTITAVAPNPRSWDSQKGGPMFDYKVDLTDSDGSPHAGIKLTQKATSNPPQVGAVLDGTIEQTDFGPKFKKNFQPGGFGGSGPRPMDPKQIAGMQRAHAQEMGLRYAAIRAEKEMLPEPFKLADLKTVIDWFEKDVQDRVEQA